MSAQIEAVLKQRDSAIRALEAIDRIVGDDWCEELDMINLHRKLRGRLATARQKISAVYMIAHAEIPTHCCYDVHGDWRQIKERVLAGDGIPDETPSAPKVTKSDGAGSVSGEAEGGLNQVSDQTQNTLPVEEKDLGKPRAV